MDWTVDWTMDWAFSHLNELFDCSIVGLLLGPELKLGQQMNKRELAVISDCANLQVIGHLPLNHHSGRFGGRGGGGGGGG